MREVVEYTRGDYATALMKGRSDPQATEAMLRRVTELTGPEPQFVRRAGGRRKRRPTCAKYSATRARWAAVTIPM